MKKSIQVALCTISFLTALFLNLSVAFGSGCTLNGGCPGACSSATTASACNTTCCTQSTNGKEVNYLCAWGKDANTMKCMQSDVVLID